jgi:hypothetical protein
MRKLKHGRAAVIITVTVAVNEDGLRKDGFTSYIRHGRIVRYGLSAEE